VRIIGYTYEADCYCVPCAQKRNSTIGFSVPLADMERAGGLAKDAHGLALAAQDREGNPIHPMFSTDEQLEPQFCGACRERIE